MEKYSKKRLLGPPMSRSKLYENGPEIVESKKYTIAHSIPDVTPRNK